MRSKPYLDITQWSCKYLNQLDQTLNELLNGPARSVQRLHSERVGILMMFLSRLLHTLPSWDLLWSALTYTCSAPISILIFENLVMTYWHHLVLAGQSSQIEKIRNGGMVYKLPQRSYMYMLILIYLPYANKHQPSSTVDGVMGSPCLGVFHALNRVLDWKFITKYGNLQQENWAGTLLHHFFALLWPLDLSWRKSLTFWEKYLVA